MVYRRFLFAGFFLCYGAIGGFSLPACQAQDSTVVVSEAEQTAEAEKTNEAQETKAAPVKVRLLALSGSYVDLVQGASLDPTSLILGGGPAKQKSFYKLCDAIDELTEDDEIHAVAFDLSDAELEMNSAQLDELARRMANLKKANKKTIAWLESASNVHLAVAANCDSIILADFGGVDMPSSSMETMFYRDAMDLVGVQASVVRAGDFKGAVEPYLNPKMSDHLRKHYLEMLSSINGAAVSRIAEGRGIPVAEVRELQKKRMLLPKQALASGLVDQLAPFGTMKESMQKVLGADVEWITTPKKQKKEMSFFELVGTLMAGPPEKSSKVREPSIAVLHFSGDIVDGKKEVSGSIVSGPAVEAIKALEDDDNVKGVVVRINSPGGSATASEVIRQGLVSLAAKKPTVVSMGSMAASGGYWISCIGQPVYAERGTITGSIGVFAMKLSIGSMLRRVGVHVESITLDDSAAAFALNRTWSDEDNAVILESIDEVYGRFLALVSESRKMPVETVKPLAGGRVWSGEQAKAAGLVDAIGGVDDCIAVVAKKASLESYKTIHRPLKSSGFDLMELLGSDEEEEIFSSPGWQATLRVMESKGLRLGSLRWVLKDLMSSQRSFPKVWALHPAEISVH